MSIWDTPEEAKNVQKKQYYKQLQQQFASLALSPSIRECVEPDRKGCLRDFHSTFDTAESNACVNHTCQPRLDGFGSRSAGRGQIEVRISTNARRSGLARTPGQHPPADRTRRTASDRRAGASPSLRRIPNHTFTITRLGTESQRSQTSCFQQTSEEPIPSAAECKREIERICRQGGNGLDNPWRRANQWYFEYFYRFDGDTTRISEADPWQSNNAAKYYVRKMQAASLAGESYSQKGTPGLMAIEQAIAFVTLEESLLERMQASVPQSWGSLWDHFGVPTSHRFNLLCKLETSNVKDESTAYPAAEFSICRTCGGVRQYCRCSPRSECKRIGYSWPNTWGSR